MFIVSYIRDRRVASEVEAEEQRAQTKRPASDLQQTASSCSRARPPLGRAAGTHKGDTQRPEHQLREHGEHVDEGQRSRRYEYIYITYEFASESCEDEDEEANKNMCLNRCCQNNTRKWCAAAQGRSLGKCAIQYSHTRKVNKRRLSSHELSVLSGV